MKITLLVIGVILFAWLQLIYPAIVAPFQLIPDFSLLVVFALALHYEPREHVLWFALAAGLALDIWQPSHFGMWTVAALAVALTTILTHSRLLPSSHWGSIFATASLALSLGMLVLVLRENFHYGFALGSWGRSLVRIYLPKLVLDVLLAVPMSGLIKRFIRSLRISPDRPLITNASRRY